MPVDLQIKKGDTRDWRFVLSDTGTTALNLTDNVYVKFRLKTKEWSTTALFDRNTAGTGSDYITVSDATNGVVTITPTESDWNDVSDFGIHVAEFEVKDSNSDIQYVEDIVIDIREALW